MMEIMVVLGQCLGPLATILEKLELLLCVISELYIEIK